MTAREPIAPLDRDPAGDEEEEGLDLEQIRERLGFMMRAPRRHPKLAASAFVVAGALGVVVAVTMPRTYESQVKLLAQRNIVVPALTNPTNRAMRDAAADSPTRNVSNLIMRRENLAALCTELDLTNRFFAARSPALRFKDSVLGGPTSDADRTYTVVGTLEKRLYVQADDSTVTISVDWADPQQAYDIVSHVQQNFLEARYDDEVAMIGDAIAVLQGHAKTERDNLDVALEEYQKLLAEVPSAQPPRTAVVVRRPTGGGGGGGGGAAPTASATVAAPDPALTASLEDKRRQIRALEDERQREVAGLRQQLTQAQLTLTPQHPAVIALQQQIDTLSQPAPELAQLKSEERALMVQMASAPSPTTAGSAPRPAPRANYGPGGVAAAPLPAIPPLPAGWETDGRAQLARSKLEAAIKGYQDVSDRIDAANIELEIARTAFKYRYSVVTPAEVPKKPKKPIGWIIGLASLPGAMLLAILLAAAADAWRGRLLEAWQVRRKLKVDVLGELDA
jgi:uncharacterized protein involved in exopolysaccharide biosynthesis